MTSNDPSATPEQLCHNAVLARERGSVDLALQLFAEAVNRAPDDPRIRAELALTRMLTGDLQGAEDEFRAVEQLAPGNPDVLANLAALLQHRGHLQEAISIYRAILAHNPDEIELRCNLAKALADCGDADEALNEADTAIELSDGTRGSLATRGAVLIDARNYAAARDALLQAIGKEPADDMTLVNLALCSNELDDLQGAVSYLIRAVELNPHNARAVADLINALSACGDDEQALSLARGFLGEHPGERLVLGALAQALLNNGKADDAHALLDCDSLVQVFDLPVPDGYASADAFHAELADELLDDPSLIRDPVSKATTGGAQTGELDLPSSPAKQAFAMLVNGAVAAAVATYRARGLTDHPVMQPAADDWSLRAWGTVIDAGGQQSPHMHPLGWLSAVYYVALPDTLSDNNRDGWLEFGAPPQRMYCKTKPATRSYEPRPGRLVLFPSWFWHCTLPFTNSADAAQARISIAFDVMPANRLGEL